MNQDDKIKLAEHSLSLLQSKEQAVKEEIDALRDAIANDSKSSMGDKYETSREMSQQEINRLDQQLAQIKQQEFQLKSVNFTSQQTEVTAGSLVETNIGNFLISVALSEVKMNGSTTFLISQASPLGQQLIGKKTNDTFLMNGKQIQIKNIL